LQIVAFLQCKFAGSVVEKAFWELFEPESNNIVHLHLKECKFNKAPVIAVLQMKDYDFEDDSEEEEKSSLRLRRKRCLSA